MPTRALHGSLYRPVPPYLRKLREEAELTQRALGERIGRPQSWVQKCETAERRVDVAEFILWCGGCGVEPAEALRSLGKLLPQSSRPSRGTDR